MLKLEIVTPEKKIVETEAEIVNVPTASGEAGILPNHAPLISALKPGILSYTNRGATERIAIGGGFLEVNHDKVSVLADSAETTNEINAEEARADRDAAEKALAELINHPVEEGDTVRERLEAANARLQLVSGK
ncbi:MAG TPA: ATP synthase F1 subunit epsilon [Pyrinomonadaceae bacterium]|nr:ATP synthase F1 subunit epsilon [Pyrinomonadaceae bacterium]